MASLTEGMETPDKIRSSQQCWLPWDHWIGGILHNIMISANNDYFHYDLDHFDSAIQVTRYEPGQEYQWHVDQLEIDKPTFGLNHLSFCLHKLIGIEAKQLIKPLRIILEDFLKYMLVHNKQQNLCLE